MTLRHFNVYENSIQASNSQVYNPSPFQRFYGNSLHASQLQSTQQTSTGAPNGSVPQNICSSGTFLLAGRCGRNNSPWKESVAGTKIIQGVRGDLKSRIAATGYLYGLLTTQDLNCAL